MRKRCSLERAEDKTPPNSSVSLAIFNAEPLEVDCGVSFILNVTIHDSSSYLPSPVFLCLTGQVAMVGG